MFPIEFIIIVIKITNKKPYIYHNYKSTPKYHSYELNIHNTKKNQMRLLYFKQHTKPRFFFLLFLFPKKKKQKKCNNLSLCEQLLRFALNFGGFLSQDKSRQQIKNQNF